MSGVGPAKAIKSPPTSLWKEAHHLNPWLAGEDGLQALNEILPAKWQLASAEYQQPAGDLFVDVLGHTVTGAAIVVEVQLGQSDHDHLGKLLTYCSVYGAEAAVWVVGSARPEHVAAINLLNQSALAEFYLVKLEAVSVDGSAAAAYLTHITGPAPVFKKAAQVKADLKASDAAKLAFWQQFLPEAKIVDAKFGLKKAVPRGRLGISSNRFRVRYVVGLLAHSSSVELVILTGAKGKGEHPETVLAELQARVLFSTELSVNGVAKPVEWVSAKRSRIRIVLPGGYEDAASWQEMRAEILATLATLMSETQQAMATLNSRPLVNPELVEESGDDESP